MTIEQMEQAEARALQRLVQAEVAKERTKELEARRRERQQEALQKQVEAANSEFETALAELRQRMQQVTASQTEWRKRFDAVLSELDALSDSQPTIQQEIKAILQDTESAVYQARQAGALISASTQDHFDSIGGANSDLWPFPAGVSNSRFGAPDTIANNLALNVCPGKVYRPDLAVDGRKRQ